MRTRAAKYKFGPRPGARARGESLEIQRPDREFPQNDIDGIIFLFCGYVGRIFQMKTNNKQPTIKAKAENVSLCKPRSAYSLPFFDMLKIS